MKSSLATVLHRALRARVIRKPPTAAQAIQVSPEGGDHEELADDGVSRRPLDASNSGLERGTRFVEESELFGRRLTSQNSVAVWKSTKAFDDLVVPNRILKKAIKGLSM